MIWRKRIPQTGRRKLNLEESQELICMSKLRNFAELAPNIGFLEFDFLTSIGKRLKERIVQDEGTAFAPCDGVVFRACKKEYETETGAQVDGNPAHLLRHPHGKRGAVDRQNRAESTVDACLERKQHIEMCFHRGTTPLSLRMDK